MKTEQLTRSRIMAMDATELNRAVAQQMGWETMAHVGKWAYRIEAAYQLEEGLSGEQVRPYGSELLRIVGQVYDADTGGHVPFERIEAHPFEIAHASPADRCRAWLLTMMEVGDE